MHPLLDAIDHHAHALPAHLAVADQGLHLTYAQFHALAGGLAGHIAAASHQPRVGIMAPTSSAGAVALYACWYAGRTPVPLNFLLAPEELGKIIRDAELDLVVTIERFAAPLAAAGARTLLLSGASTLVPGRAQAPQRAGSDLGVLLYTSGTSGDPKGVCLSFDNLSQNVRAAVEHERIDPQQVFLSVLPQFHTFGLTAMTLVPLQIGATVHFLPRFSPVTVIETIAAQGVTVFMAVASMYAALCASKSADRSAFATLWLAVSGGEPLPPRVAATFEQRFGVRILEGYGLTEASPIVSINAPWKHRAGSVGSALPGLDVYTVAEDGTRRPRAAGAAPADIAAATGEIVVRGHGVMQGYHRKPEQTARVLRDGALHTGDVGYIDADGFIFITGRAKELLIVGGENVFPGEIENVLAEHPAVGEVAVIGVRDELRGELPVAYVILKEGATATETDLREFCRGRLAGYKVPRRVQFVPDLPRGPTGKVLKRALPAQP